MNKKRTYILTLVALLFLFSAFTGVNAKSLYLSANHHTAEFDAWNIDPFGIVTKQSTYILQHSTDPAGIGIDEITPNDEPLLFITSEFSGGIEIVNPVNLTYFGVSSGPSNLAGVDVDDLDNVVFTLKRQNDDLYIYNWDETTKTLNMNTTVQLENLSYGYGIAFDDSRDILWVTDTGSSMIRAYDMDVVNWNDIEEIESLSGSVSHAPIDIAVDMVRNRVFTVAGYAGSSLLSMYDVATETETTHDLGIGGIGVAVDDLNGYVYMTRGTSSSADDIQVWDVNTDPFTLIQDTERIGNPAGLCVPKTTVFNPLNLTMTFNIDGNTVNPGQNIQKSICFDNLQNGLEVHNVTLNDTLPSELIYLSSSDGGIYDPINHTVTWDIGTLPADAPLQCVTVDCRVDQMVAVGTNITNFATINGDEAGYSGPTTIHVTVETSNLPPGEARVPIMSSMGIIALISIIGVIAFFELKKKNL